MKNREKEEKEVSSVFGPWVDKSSGGQKRERESEQKKRKGTLFGSLKESEKRK